ncbi:hypothetical protein R5M92_15955 [Halomonas sp. Bachu 37]|uniref:hypothetical protein n=1 Tax=Halomonas kashgarensis TaxID=3084920 RepID=UPI003217A13F
MRNKFDVSRHSTVFQITQAISLLTMSWVAMAFSCSVSAEENPFNSASIDDKIAHAFVTENKMRLISEAQFDESRANVARIRQTGDGNSTEVNQNRSIQGRANYASIDQIGNFNEATINQMGSNHTGIVKQTGDNLEANITQLGNQQETLVRQAGLGGRVDILQAGSGYQGIIVEQQAHSGITRPLTIETY